MFNSKKKIQKKNYLFYPFTKLYNVSRNHLDSQHTNDIVDTQPQRYTPCKFTVDHSTASLSNGLMVLVKPQFSMNDVTNVVKILNISMYQNLIFYFKYYL